MLLLVVFFIPSVSASDTRYEYYDNTPSSDVGMYTVYWRGQTFTPGNVGESVPHYFTSFKVKCHKHGAPPSKLWFRLYVADAAHKPSGAVKSQGSIATSGITTDANGAFYECTNWNVTTYTLSPSTEYVIVMNMSGGDGSNKLDFNLDWLDGAYAGGYCITSDNSSAGWAIRTAADFMFYEYGISRAPSFSNPSPANSSTGQSTTPKCAITITSPTGASMTLTWFENSTGIMVNRQQNASVANGTYRWTFAQATSKVTKYYWHVHVTDGTTNLSAWYCFTTRNYYYPNTPVYFEARTQNDSWIQLNWTKGTTGVSKTVIIANDTGYPSLDDCIILYNGTNSGYNHTGLVNNTHWFYRCYSWNSTDSKYSNISLRSHDTTEGINLIDIIYTNNNSTGSYTIEYAVNYTTPLDCDEDYNSLLVYSADINDDDWGTSDTQANGDLVLRFNKPAFATGVTWYVKLTEGNLSFISNDSEFNSDPTYIQGEILNIWGDLSISFDNFITTRYENVASDGKIYEMGIRWMYGTGWIVNLTSTGLFTPIFVNMVLNNATGSNTLNLLNNYSGYLVDDADYYVNPAGVDANDSDWGTFDTIPDGTYYLVRYNKPDNAVGAFWWVKTSEGNLSFYYNAENFSYNSDYILGRLNYEFGELDFFTGTSSPAAPTGYWMRYFNVSSDGRLYEEGVIWCYNAYVVNFTSESQLNLTFNLTHATETHYAVWNSGTGFWDILLNVTGNGTGGTNVTVHIPLTGGSGGSSLLSPVSLFLGGMAGVFLGVGGLVLFVMVRRRRED